MGVDGRNSTNATTVKAASMTTRQKILLIKRLRLSLMSPEAKTA